MYFVDIKILLIDFLWILLVFFLQQKMAPGKDILEFLVYISCRKNIFKNERKNIAFYRIFYAF